MTSIYQKPQQMNQQQNQNQPQALNSPWTQNLMKAAGYVQNGGNNAYKKYNPNATNTQQQKMAQQYSTQQQNPGNSNKRDWERGIMSDPIGPSNTGNSNWGGLGNTINNAKNNTNQQQPTAAQSSLQQILGQLTSGDSTQFQKIFQALQQQQQQTAPQTSQPNIYRDPTYKYRLEEQQLLNDPNTRAQAQQLWNNSSMTQPVKTSQNVNNTANANQLAPGLRANVSASGQVTNTAQNKNNTSQSEESIPVNSFMKWTGEGDNTAVFNPTMAPVSAPNYVKKEGSYGDYDTSVEKQKTYADEIGSLGGRAGGIDLFTQIAQGIDVPTGPSSNVTNAYVNLDDTLEKMAGSADVEAAPDSGYISSKGSDADKTLDQMTDAANVQASPDSGYRERDEKKGYSVDDLNLMAQNGYNSLSDAYQNALNKAAANYNRLGLRGSGFELADEFGNQSDSITSNYFKNVQQLQNDIASKGLEAEREDRKWETDANEANRQFWSQFGNNLGNQNFSNLAQLAGLQMDFSKMDEGNRSNWANYFTNLAQQNYSNKGQLAGLQQTFGNSQNANELDWDKYRTSVKQSNINDLKDVIKLYQGIMGQSNDQQGTWATINGGLGKNDWDALMGIWNGSLDINKLNTEQKNDLTKTMLAALATGAQGGKEGFNAMTGYFGDPKFAEYIRGMMNAAGYNA